VRILVPSKPGAWCHGCAELIRAELDSRVRENDGMSGPASQVMAENQEK